jgi:hypothetical protein
MEKAESGARGGDASGAAPDAREAAKRLGEAAGKVSGRAAEERKRAEEEMKRLAERQREQAERMKRLAERLKKQEGTPGMSKAAGAVEDAASSTEGAADSTAASSEEGSDRGEGRRAEAARSLAKARDALQDPQVRKRQQEALRDPLRDQKKLSSDTKEMAKGLPSGGPEGGSSGSQAGQEAAGAMDRAAGGMEEGDGSSAEENQKEAERKLKEIQEELAEQERRYEGIHQEEALFRIAKELAGLLEGQGAVNTEVKNVDAKRVASEGNLSRFDRQTLKDLQTREADLASKSEFVAASIEKEGSDVYGFVLRSVTEDMRRLASSLQGLETGDPVQVLGAEILRNLKKLADALKIDRETLRKLAEERPKGGGGGGDSKPSLVPPDAELRLLRDLQLDINAAVEDLQRDSTARPGPDESRRSDAERLAQRQRRLRDIWLKLAEKFHLPTEEQPAEGH